MKRGTWIVKIVAFVLLAIVALSWITMWLWNWLVPDLFHGPQINYWQTMGLLLLSKILFSGFTKGHRHGGGPWRPYWKEKWNTMSPEERERFKQKLKDKWCGWNEHAAPTEKPNT
ncbi:MAG: hypothetical protein JST48_14115 [Bacteroidetes bacterium]|nr:hypothetical protein [Bacteroidota bacterium]